MTDISAEMKSEDMEMHAHSPGVALRSLVILKCRNSAISSTVAAIEMPQFTGDFRPIHRWRNWGAEYGWRRERNRDRTFSTQFQATGGHRLIPFIRPMGFLNRTELRRVPKRIRNGIRGAAGRTTN